MGNNEDVSGSGVPGICCFEKAKQRFEFNPETCDIRTEIDRHKCMILSQTDYCRLLGSVTPMECYRYVVGEIEREDAIAQARIDRRNAGSNEPQACCCKKLSKKKCKYQY